MLRTYLTQGSRCVASTSKAHQSYFNTCTVALAENPRKRIARAVRKGNTEHKAERGRRAIASRPSVILGTRPGDESKWLNCELSKILVDEEALTSPSADLEPIDRPTGTVWLPKQLAYSVGDTEKRLLFETLPSLSVESRVKAGGQSEDLSSIGRRYARGEEQELHKTNSFAKLIDLRNANAGGISFENRRRIIAAFSEPRNPFDPGRAEVQAALLTYKIRNLWSHLSKFKRDLGNRRGLRKLVHRRAKVLRYLKQTNRDRYDDVLERLALEPESVEGELIV